MRRVAEGWVKNLQEMEDEARKLFGENYLGMRYEDLLSKPFDEMTKLWNFLGVRQIDPSLSEEIETEMASNPDEEWQAKRNEGNRILSPQGTGWELAEALYGTRQICFQGSRGGDAGSLEI